MGGWIVAIGFAAQDGICCREKLDAVRRPDAAAGRLEALLVPGSDWINALFQKILGGGDQVFRLDNLVNRPSALAREAVSDWPVVII